jgi:hypothetical protein
MFFVTDVLKDRGSIFFRVKQFENSSSVCVCVYARACACLCFIGMYEIVIVHLHEVCKKIHVLGLLSIYVFEVKNY